MLSEMRFVLISYPREKAFRTKKEANIRVKNKKKSNEKKGVCYNSFF